MSTNTSTELLMSGSIRSMSINLTTFSSFTNPSYPSVNSNLSLGFRLPAGFLFTPQVRYEYTRQKFIAMKFELEKRVFRNGIINALYEQNFSSDIRNLQIGFRYDFSFAQTAFTARIGNTTSSFIESARGSIMADAKTKYIGFTNRTSVGRGGIVILPYLDENCNNRRDPGEERAFGLGLNTNGGYMVQDKKDTTIRITDLEPYTNYLIELNPTSFDNVAWQIRHRLISVAVTPNQFKLIEVPVAVFGEAAGTVLFENPQGQRGQGRVIVSFYRADSTLAGRTLTEEDGYFSFLGLGPGDYFVRIDPAQLKKLHMESSPSFIPISIRQSRDGDVADGLEFVIRKTE
jgi:hypothetical protein